MLDKQAFLTSELAKLMNLSPVCTRRYLRIAYEQGALVRQRYGRYWYYAFKKVLEENAVLVCLNCGRIIEKLPCECGSSRAYEAVKDKNWKSTEEVPIEFEMEDSA